MSELQKILTSHFGDLTIDVVRSNDYQEPGVTRQQLGEMLGYENPRDAIRLIHNRHKDRFLNNAMLFKTNPPSSGGSQETWVYNFKGVLEVCRYSEQPLANAVIDWAWDTLDKLRNNELIPGQTLNFLTRRIETLEDENLTLRRIIDYHDGSDHEFSFDYVAHSIAQFMKPPFTPKHFRHWLESKGILTRLSYKNDAPRQEYINRGWFKTKTYHWERRGKCHHLESYVFTARGLNAVLRLAIEERFLQIPVTNQLFLLGGRS